MSKTIHIRTFSPKTAEMIRHNLTESFNNLWLSQHAEEIFRICDELIKNGIKSNYKTILYWMEARKRFQEKNPDLSIDEIDDWLYEVFYSGEDGLVSIQFNRIEKEKILKELRSVLTLEAMYIDHRMGRRNLAKPKILKDLVDIKRFCRKHNIGVQMKIESSSDQIQITITNDAPILNEDLERIQSIRSTFRRYQVEQKEDQFFLENINTEGGGHGLGYPLMDSVLTAMNLDPDTSLFLISATRTMILLNLPTTAPRVELNF